MNTTRRDFLQLALFGAGGFALGPGADVCIAASAASSRAAGGSFGALGPPDANGLRVAAGFVGRLVARSGEAPVRGTKPWHASPDGAACVPRAGGGWTYVSNCEIEAPRGAVSALDFDAKGNVVAVRTLLEGADGPCAGGLSGRGHWLACEEVPHGRVWEVDITGVQRPVLRPALGTFNHEAAARDPRDGRIYLTEDDPQGGLYRFTPARPNDLAAGTLEVLARRRSALLWVPVPDPSASRGVPTRRQVADMLPFNGGEGAWFGGGELSFTTKGDDRLWVYHPQRNTLVVLYDGNVRREAPLRGVDNVIQDAAGVRYVAEDGGDMQVCTVDRAGHVGVIAQVVGTRDSEITGLAFSPDGSRLYFSSQREPGATYELRGPFRAAAPRPRTG